MVHRISDLEPSQVHGYYSIEVMKSIGEHLGLEVFYSTEDDRWVAMGDCEKNSQDYVVLTDRLVAQLIARGALKPPAKTESNLFNTIGWGFVAAAWLAAGIVFFAPTHFSQPSTSCPSTEIAGSR